MATIPNPPIFDESNPPAALQTLRLNAAGTGWEPCAITAAAIIVPAAHENAPAAITAAAVVAANAATQSGSYVQADAQTIATLANANKVEVNHLVADVTALRTELATLVAALQGAQILAAT